MWGVNQEAIDASIQAGENVPYLPGVPLPSDWIWTSDPETACANADAFVIAVPTRYYPTTLANFRDFIPASARMISVSKGLVDNRILTDVAQEILALDDISALSGPSHAEEVAREAPTAVTIASSNESHALYFQSLFNNPHFRTYTSTDLTGVELGGALKNVIAIAAGVADGLGYGDNTKAALITRGLAEICRLGAAAGGRAETFTGLSGAGDLIVTCGSQHSRNRSFGERIGKGETIQEIEASMHMVAEGVWNAKTAKKLADDLGIDAPITSEVYAILYEGKDPKEAVNSLLSRDPKPEV